MRKVLSYGRTCTSKRVERMNDSVKFDHKKLDKLNDPSRLKILDPNVIWNALSLNAPDVMIDIGAGTGVFALAFATKISNGKIYACDLSEVMIEWMKNNITEKNILPTQCSENSIDLPNKIADLVYMINVHHELLEPEKMITEAYRLLKPQGKIAIIDWKKEQMEQGPPLNIRIHDTTIVRQLQDMNFKKITNHDLLPFHNFITGEK